MWLREKCEEGFKGIDDVRAGDKKAEIELHRPLPIDDVAELIKQREDFEVEESEDHISVQKKEDVGEYQVTKAYGTTLYNKKIIELGSPDPIGPDMEPTDDAVEGTLDIVVSYLQNRYE